MTLQIALIYHEISAAKYTACSERFIRQEQDDPYLEKLNARLLRAEKCRTAFLGINIKIQNRHTQKAFHCSSAFLYCSGRYSPFLEKISREKSRSAYISIAENYS